MIDTLKISRRLENANFSEKQAEELADILREAVEGDLVTKDHFDARLAQIDARLAQIDARIAQMDARMAQMDARIAQMEARLIRWMIGLTLAGMGTWVALARAALVIS
jgi:DNA-binding transcriptional MerR regulator